MVDTCLSRSGALIVGVQTPNDDKGGMIRLQDAMGIRPSDCPRDKMCHGAHCGEGPALASLAMLARDRARADAA